MEAHNAATEVRTVVKTLEVGDVISVPQYKNALKVNHTGELNGEANSYIGVEFVDNPTNADKSMVVNINSGRVYLRAGRTDKGEVTDIKMVN